MKKLEPRETPCYCIQLKRAANTVTKIYDKALEPSGLTTRQFSLLNDIKLLGTCSRSQLADYAMLDRTTITRNLKTLIEKGYVTDLTGRGSRDSKLEVSVSGHKVLDESYVYWKNAQKHIKEKIGKQNMPFITDMLKNIAKLESEQGETP